MVPGTCKVNVPYMDPMGYSCTHRDMVRFIVV